jgi:hypothetical protein
MGLAGKLRSNHISMLRCFAMKQICSVEQLQWFVSGVQQTMAHFPQSAAFASEEVRPVNQLKFFCIA